MTRKSSLFVTLHTQALNLLAMDANTPNIERYIVPAAWTLKTLRPRKECYFPLTKETLKALKAKFSYQTIENYNIWDFIFLYEKCLSRQAKLQENNRELIATRIATIMGAALDALAAAKPILAYQYGILQAQSHLFFNSDTQATQLAVLKTLQGHLKTCEKALRQNSTQDLYQVEIFIEEQGARLQKKIIKTCQKKDIKTRSDLGGRVANFLMLGFGTASTETVKALMQTDILIKQGFRP